MSAGYHLEEEITGKAYDARLMRRFAGHLRPYAGWVGLSALAIAIQIALELAGPAILMRALDGPVAARDAGGLLRYAALFLAAIAGTAAAYYAQGVLTNRVGQRVVFDLRTRLFRHLQALPVAFYDRNPVGRLVVRVTNDIESLGELFTSGVVAAAADLLLIIGIAAAMFVLDARLAALALSVTPLVILVAVLFRRVARETYREQRRKIARLNAYLNENVQGAATVQAFGREAVHAARFRAINAEHRDAGIASVTAYAFFFPSVEFLSAGTQAILLALGGAEILRGGLSFGAFLAFWYYAQKFFQPIRELSEKYNILQSAMASAERVFKILDTPPDIAAPPDPVPIGGPAGQLWEGPSGPNSRPCARGEVEFRDVDFSYVPDVPVLKKVSFRVAPGERLAIVGHTGSGKTTIASLLSRLYDVTAGEVRVDGTDVRRFDPRALRRTIGVVAQDVFLFSGPVERNIRLGEEGIPPERVREAARIARLDRRLDRLPGGLATELTDRGANLSAGERQLLAFARALAFDPPILVLDEATSAVDSETEALIQEGMEGLLKGRTAILIAHRLSTLRRADRILVLHRGEVRESGSHAELLKLNGLYATLHRLQFREEDGLERPSVPQEEPEAPEVRTEGG